MENRYHISCSLRNISVFYAAPATRSLGTVKLLAGSYRNQACSTIKIWNRHLSSKFCTGRVRECFLEPRRICPIHSHTIFTPFCWGYYRLSLGVSYRDRLQAKLQISSRNVMSSRHCPQMLRYAMNSRWKSVEHTHRIEWLISQDASSSDRNISSYICPPRIKLVW